MSTQNRLTLADYVKEQKQGKNGSASASSLLSNGLSNSLSNFNFKTKFVNGFPFSRGADDDGALIDNSTSGSSTPGSSKSPNSNAGGGRWSFISSSESAFGLSRTQRLFAFFVCISAAMFCFGLASLYIPVLLLKSRKFASLNTLGSCFLVFSFALLWGPRAYMAHLFSKERLPVTTAYFCSVLATLYTSLWLSSTILTFVCAIIQMGALIWFVLSYIPGGESGLRMLTNLCARLFCSKSALSKTILPV